MEEQQRERLLKDIRNVTPESFGKVALSVFRYQAAHNDIYAQFLDLLRVDPSSVSSPTDIPHMPIALFKKYRLQSGDWDPVRTFTSSGTTGTATSHHPLRNEEWYRENARKAFELQYGPLKDRPVLALLPAYLERTGSSLVFMADDFIQQSGHPESGFFLDDLPELSRKLSALKNSPVPPLLIGVSFALLDLAEDHAQPLGGTIVMETGGMKGRRREMTRPELHGVLSRAFGVEHIHSEYGMTELLSQAYAPKDGLFLPAPTLRAQARDITDPLALVGAGKTGALNLTDLANFDTISFIATDDLGRVYPNGSFEVLGRLDASDVRGCNLLVL
ncbi:acyl transferase [Neolewinella aurantiaca]|uniref:Acyl transferase n=1 Tax=Neolewinella aurantiaca TaxID=2602767 RepID=A0A5C7FML5_9BACT|nr:acyl transferase [Neolewinella aurantiaca]TXF86005.1 acyl transferase [Neolewinella aurantiaca]